MRQNTRHDFWARVKVEPNGCWSWQGAITAGYGQFQIAGRRHVASRFAYEDLRGPIPEGLVLDHQCHNLDLTCQGGRRCVHRRCVNPAHLEPVPQAVNLIRSQHTVNKYTSECPRGHEVNEENCGWYRGSRYCNVCRREKYHAAKNAARLANVGG